MRQGSGREAALIGPRGEGKTQAAAWAAVLHAAEHHARGFELPTRWLGATTTHESHKLKTIPSLLEPHWLGRWKITDDRHLASYVIEGVTLTQVHLFGVQDENGMDRLRAACHGAWFEEAAPTTENQGRGLTLRQWETAQTSMRLPSHAHVGMVTSNPGTGEDDDWVWQRFHEHPEPGALLFEIPPEERASAEDRARWMAAISDPLLRKRLIEGRPAALMPGRPVAHGYTEALHLSRTRLLPIPDGALWMGQDGGLMPATVIGQRARGRVEVVAALSSEHAGIRQHWRHVVMPWLAVHAPWALGEHGDVTVLYDPALDTDAQGDSDVNALRVMRELLPRARLRPGVNVPWSARRDPLLTILASQDDGHGLLVLDREHARMLGKALEGRWHYAITNAGDVRREEPDKPNPPWADLGDACCYLLQGLAPIAKARSHGPRRSAKSAFSPYHFGKAPRPRAEFSLR